MVGEERQRASDILATDQQFDADWRLDDVKVDFDIFDFETVETQSGPAFIVHCNRDGEAHRWVTWSRVVGDQLGRLKEHFPVTARVDLVKGKGGYYYTLI